MIFVDNIGVIHMLVNDVSRDLELGAIVSAANFRLHGYLVGAWTLYQRQHFPRIQDVSLPKFRTPTIRTSEHLNTSTTSKVSNYTERGGSPQEQWDCPSYARRSPRCTGRRRSPWEPMRGRGYVTIWKKLPPRPCVGPSRSLETWLKCMAHNR